MTLLSTGDRRMVKGKHFNLCCSLWCEGKASPRSAYVQPSAFNFEKKETEICARFLAVLCLVVANIYLCMGVWTEDMRQTGAVCQNTPPLTIQ